MNARSATSSPHPASAPSSKLQLGTPSCREIPRGPASTGSRLPAFVYPTANVHGASNPKVIFQRVGKFSREATVTGSQQVPSVTVMGAVFLVVTQTSSKAPKGMAMTVWGSSPGPDVRYFIKFFFL